MGREQRPGPIKNTHAVSSQYNKLIAVYLFSMATPTTLRRDPSIGGPALVSLPHILSPFSVTLCNSLHSKSMHAIYRGTLCQGEQMYKINIRAVCARRRAMIPESHKSGRWESRGGHPCHLGGSAAENRKGEGENTTPRTFTLFRCSLSLLPIDLVNE